MAAVLAKKCAPWRLFGYIMENNYHFPYFHTSVINLSLGEWRKRKGLPVKGVEYGPLTDLPDWSYADGRPAPLSQGQKRRIMLNKEYCEHIIKLTKEVDECNELNMKKALLEEAVRQKALRNRLKKKGDSFS